MHALATQLGGLPVRSLKAAGLSWSMEASTSMGVRHF